MAEAGVESGADFATDGFPMHGITDPAHIADLLTAWGYLGIFIAVFADKPVAFYELVYDSTTGMSAIDKSGNSNTGTYSDGVSFSEPGPFASTQQPKAQ
jgi:hypothetical protein